MVATATKPAIFPGQRFELGTLAMTCGIENLVIQGLNPIPYLIRHSQGDWGDLPVADVKLNNSSLVPGNEGRLFSSYEISDKLKIWIITEWDRSVTTLLLPSEY